MRTLADQLTIADADGTNERPYPLLDWSEEGASDDGVEAGAKVRHVRRFWGGGMGETAELGRGGYYFSENAYHGDPFALKPRPTIGVVTLTGNANPVERFFEALDAASSKYVYALAGAKSFKIKLSDRTLAETKTFSGGSTVFAQGSYTGDGAATKAITGVGFAPCAVIVKGDNAEAAVIRTTDMTALYSTSFNPQFSLQWGTAGVRSLDADGFTVGNHAAVNTNGVVYYWSAFKTSTSEIVTGHYTGSGAAKTISGVGFKPDLLHVLKGKADNYAPQSRVETFDGYNISVAMGGGGSGNTGKIPSVTGDGFTIGTDLSVNENAIEYYWLAVRKLSGQFTFGTYVGDGADNRPITGVGFQPIHVVICAKTPADYSDAYLFATFKGMAHATTAGSYYGPFANGADLIKSLDVDGFTIGNNAYVNVPGYVFHYLAIGAVGTPQVGKPVQWISKYRVPLGEGADVQTLTTVAVPAATDTWTRNYGLAARHFCVKANNLGRACLKRYVSLCAADDIGNLGNWGADYAVGSPDVVITDLVEWSDELAVCATDGMYMFDGVATSRQQLPLLGGLKDADNGKNTLGMASFIFYPSADGFWRWQYGAHKRVDPDADRYYVKAKETSNEPINLKHYGSAFCGDHVYHAAYDGTNYLLLHGKLNEEGELIWDCLISTTNAIKTVYLDSNRYLWFGWGTDLAYIVLKQGGEPTGGTFGNASLVTTIYEREIILAEDAEVRLRMVKVITRQMPGATFKWQVFASRDGGTFVQVGLDITADGVSKCYFTAASNLTARRIRLKYVGTATAGFTPDATPPEITFAGVYGEAKPDDAEAVKATINLDDTKGSRAGVTLYDELKARENAGVVQVRHPIKGTMLNMIIYGVALATVRQKGYEEPVGVAIVSMRRGDVA